MQEDAERFYAKTVLTQGDTRIRLATVEWPKEAFATWWARARSTLQGSVDLSRSAYRLPAIDGRAECADDTWTATDARYPSARQRHTAVWTGRHGNDCLGRGSRNR